VWRDPARRTAPGGYEKETSLRARIATCLALATLITVPLVLSSPAAIGSAPIGPAHAAPHAQAAKFPWNSGGARSVPGRIVIVWRHGASRVASSALSAQLGATTTSRPAPGIGVVQLPPGASEAAAIHRLERSPLVRSAEPDRIASPMALPNDTHFAQQWALNNTGQSHRMTNQGLGGTTRTGTPDADVDAPEAWAAQTVHDPTVVAVLDTGVDINHPDLQNSLWTNPGEIPGDGIDNDGNGFIDDVHGWDFGGHDNNPTPSNSLENSHGTHVAGIIAAEQNNSEGISGVCPDCQIMALRVGSASSLTLGHQIAAFEYAIQMGAQVINLSLGSPVWSKAERSEIAKAGRAGILVVVAAGNAGEDNDIQFYADPRHGAWAPSYPASYSLSNILSVAASNDRDHYAYFSQCEGVLPLWRCGFTSWGHDSVDVAAPGVDILSTVKVGATPTAYPNYDVWDGTSMAAPMVAGIAGLVLSENPTDTPVQVKNAIMNSVDHPSALTLHTMWAKITGVGKSALHGQFTRTQGRVNVLGALTGATTSATPTTDGNIDGARQIRKRRAGKLAWPSDDNDVYKKRLVKGHKYAVTLDGSRGSDLDLWVWRPGTKDIFQFTIGCFTRGGSCPALATASASPRSDEQAVFRATRSGTYYFQVNSWYSHGRYTLRVKRT
jgi:subtilisin family serine protease